MVEDIKFWVANHQLTYLSPSRDNDGTCKFCNSPDVDRRLFCERCLPERSEVDRIDYTRTYNLLYRACGFIDGAGRPSCRLSRPKPPAVPKPLAVMPCGVCGTIFKQVQTQQKFCSKKCSKSASRRRSIDRKRPDRKRRGVCMYCGIACQYDQAFACDPCKLEKRREYQRRYIKLHGKKKYKKPSKRGVCRKCGVKCENYVCAACQYDVIRRDRRKYRKRMEGVESEPYTHGEIAQRDGWRCQLCRKPVNPRKRHPDPMCASIDHIVPISQGGTDVRANVQLAHLFCNMSKGNRAVPDGEQLRLLG
jgi:hypothetical protein